MKNNFDSQYLKVLSNIINNGTQKSDRTGTGTYSNFGNTIRHKMSEGFPLLTSKKVHVKSVIKELLWFLNGNTNIKYLIDDNVNIWNGDAYKKYKQYCDSLEEPDVNALIEDINKNCLRTMTKEEFVYVIKNEKLPIKKGSFLHRFGDLGPIYGDGWRNFNGFDQIKYVINELKNNPDSRRLLVSAWQPDKLNEQTVPPCHFAFELYSRELDEHERQEIWFNNNFDSEFYQNNHVIPDFDDKCWVPTPTRELSLMWFQRSADFPLGVPFNCASYGFLLEMFAQQVDMVSGDLIGVFGDTHIYKNQLPSCKKQLGNATYNLPKLKLKKAKDIFSYKVEDFEIIDYKNAGEVTFPLSN